MQLRLWVDLATELESGISGSGPFSSIKLHSSEIVKCMSLLLYYFRCMHSMQITYCLAQSGSNAHLATTPLSVSYGSLTMGPEPDLHVSETTAFCFS